MSEITDLGDHCIEAVAWLPKDRPPLLLKDFPEAGDFTLLINDNLEGEDPAAPDHFERHGGQVIGPVAIGKLLDLLEEGAEIGRVQSPHYERMHAAWELRDRLDELLEGHDEQTIEEAARDCEALLNVR